MGMLSGSIIMAQDNFVDSSADRVLVIGNNNQVFGKVENVVIVGDNQTVEESNVVIIDGDVKRFKYLARLKML